MGNNVRKTIDFKEGLINLQEQLSENKSPEVENNSQSYDCNVWQWMERDRRLELIKKSQFVFPRFFPYYRGGKQVRGYGR